MFNQKIVLKVAEKNRITVPLQAARRLGAQPGDYIKLLIAKGGQERMFYVQVPQVQPSRKYLQTRRAIPEDIAEELEIKQGDEVELNSLELIRRKKPAKIFTNGKIDLLAALPNCSKSECPLMVDNFMRGGEEWMRIWYSTGQGGRPKEVEIKRYLSLNRSTGEFFGLLQAEGGKSGNRFDFTNTIVEEHARLVNFVNGIVKGAEWSVDVFYNVALPIEKVHQNLQRFLKSVEISPKRVLLVKHRTVSECAFAVQIHSVVLMEIFVESLKAIRSKAAEIAKRGELDGALKEFCEGFILKDLIGDGSIHIRRDWTVGISINEADETSHADIITILNGLGFKTTPSGKNNVVILRKNRDTYLWLLTNGAFRGHDKNRGKFLMSFYNNCYIKWLSRLSKVEGELTVRQFAELVGVSKSAAHRYLTRHAQWEHLHQIEGQGREGCRYALTSKGKAIVESLEEGMGELRCLMRKYHTGNPHDLRAKLVRNRQFVQQVTL